MDYENDSSWVRSMLYPGENLLWTGKPGKGRPLRKEDLYLIPFSILWCGFAVFWELSVIKTDAPIFFKLWGIPFVLIGLYFTVGRFVVKRLREKNTRYALTSQRLIARTGKTCKTLELTNLPHMSVTQLADGSGDIRFGESAAYRPYGFGYTRTYPYQNALLEFRNIPEVNKVEYRIHSAVEQALRTKQEN